jgi:hypothetical protein
MPAASTASVADRLAALRTELVEQAYALERQGRLDAADVALAASHRLGEVCAELGDESARLAAPA